ncbi:MAG: PQQ-dependent sugar dehydrogenase [Sphingopyxis sp.]|nr:PQQ-dependent sugar dehydrogenase [Sphingopyxis sp.]
MSQHLGPARLLSLSFAALLAACSPAATSATSATDDAKAGSNGIDATGAHPSTPLANAPFAVQEIATFNQPWAMTFLPGSPYALITERGGRMLLWQEGGAVTPVNGVPQVAVGGQGGLGDIIVTGPNSTDGQVPVALSWAEGGEGNFGAVVATATFSPSRAALENLKIIWRASPKVSGRGHFGHRLAVAPDGQHLFVTTGDRQKFDPAQDMSGNLGKVLRLKLDGSVPQDNPFADRQGITAQIWSLGHRNPLGMAFDDQGTLWTHEMGPAHGDELNKVERSANYGYPIVSNGDHYDGRDIPDHPTRPEFRAPDLWWNPAISPAGLAFHDGKGFAGWGPSLLMGGLSGEALVRIAIKDGKASKAERWDMDARIREVETRADGSIWVLTDGPQGKLLKLTPKG